MVTDAELNRLRQEYSLALQREQRAYNARHHKWEYRLHARTVMNQAYQAKQEAYAKQASTWQSLQRLRDEYRPLIRKLNLLQGAAFQSAERAFIAARKARNNGHNARAQDYTTEGRCYKKEAQRYARERRLLTAKIRTAKMLHESARLAFHIAKIDFDTWRDAFESATVMFERVDTAFKIQVEIVKAGRQALQENRQALAIQAGVPFEYQSNVRVSQKLNGRTHIYFGGTCTPDGPGHGHYVMNGQGQVIYQRDPHTYALATTNVEA